jgi:hypothetical protein
MAPISKETNEMKRAAMLAERKLYWLPGISREKREEMNTYVHINSYQN